MPSAKKKTLAKKWSLDSSADIVLEKLGKNSLLMLVLAPVSFEIIRKALLYWEWVPFFVLESEPPLSLFSYWLIALLIADAIAGFHVKKIYLSILCAIAILLSIVNLKPAEDNSLIYISEKFQVLERDGHSQVYATSDLSMPIAHCQKRWLAADCERVATD